MQHDEEMRRQDEEESRRRAACCFFLSNTSLGNFVFDCPFTPIHGQGEGQVKLTGGPNPLMLKNEGMSCGQG